MFFLLWKFLLFTKFNVSVQKKISVTHFFKYFAVLIFKFFFYKERFVFYAEFHNCPVSCHINYYYFLSIKYLTLKLLVISIVSFLILFYSINKFINQNLKLFFFIPQIKDWLVQLWKLKHWNYLIIKYKSEK